MTRSDGTAEAAPGWPEGAAAAARRAGQRIERARLQTQTTQRSVARSFERSADCHDRTAASYERLAEGTLGGDAYREHAARHREFAQEDRRLAASMRQMADG
jgi:hypothetical protein